MSKRDISLESSLQSTRDSNQYHKTKPPLCHQPQIAEFRTNVQTPKSGRISHDDAGTLIMLERSPEEGRFQPISQESDANLDGQLRKNNSKSRSPQRSRTISEGQNSTIPKIGHQKKLTFGSSKKDSSFETVDDLVDQIHIKNQFVENLEKSYQQLQVQYQELEMKYKKALEQANNPKQNPLNHSLTALFIERWNVLTTKKLLKILSQFEEEPRNFMKIARNLFRVCLERAQMEIQSKTKSISDILNLNAANNECFRDQLQKIFRENFEKIFFADEEAFKSLKQRFKEIVRRDFLCRKSQKDLNQGFSLENIEAPALDMSFEETKNEVADSLENEIKKLTKIPEFRSYVLELYHSLIQILISPVQLKFQFENHNNSKPIDFLPSKHNAINSNFNNSTKCLFVFPSVLFETEYDIFPILRPSVLLVAHTNESPVKMLEVNQSIEFPTLFKQQPLNSTSAFGSSKQEQAILDHVESDHVQSQDTINLSTIYYNSKEDYEKGGFPLFDDGSLQIELSTHNHPDPLSNKENQYQNFKKVQYQTSYIDENYHSLQKYEDCPLQVSFNNERIPPKRNKSPGFRELNNLLLTLNSSPLRKKTPRQKYHSPSPDKSKEETKPSASSPLGRKQILLENGIPAEKIHPRIAIQSRETRVALTERSSSPKTFTKNGKDNVGKIVKQNNNSMGLAPLTSRRDRSGIRENGTISSNILEQNKIQRNSFLKNLN